MRSHLRRCLETIALVAPLVCLVHCMAMPILISLIPVLKSGLKLDHSVEGILNVSIVGLCVVAILPGYIEHRRKRVLGLLILGIVCILAASRLEEASFIGTISLSLAGSVCLIVSNLANRSYGKKKACCEQEH